MRVIAPPYPLELWRVARVDTVLLTEDQQAEVYAWLSELGIPYTQYRPELVVSKSALSGDLLLHLTRYVLDPFGGEIVDHAAHRVHTEPVVFAITTYPMWLAAESHKQEQAKEETGVGPCPDQ